MKNMLSIKKVLVLALFATCLQSQTANAMPALYDAITGNGAVYCQTDGLMVGSGYATILANHVTENLDCHGSLVIPENVTSINDYAFFDDELLTSITIPSKVTSIGICAFALALSLSSIIFEPGSLLTSIDLAAFYNTVSLTSITLPDSLRTIAPSAFENSRITSIVIPSGVTTIAATTFFSATRLSSVTIPNSVTLIEAGAFEYTALTSLTIPSSVRSIGVTAFNNTTALTTYTYCGPVSDEDLIAAGLGSPKVRNPCSQSGLSSSFSAPSYFDYSFTVQVTNFDAAFTYTVTTSVGAATINSKGLITVTGLSPDQSATVTVTSTRTGYDTGTASTSGRAQVAPMRPGNKPVVTITPTAITCTIGSYSAEPTSAIFSLFVDGTHISTIFSALGDYLPDWIIGWATPVTITRTGTLTSATWAFSDSYKGKAITCSTVAYSHNATGSTASEIAMVN